MTRPPLLQQALKLGIVILRRAKKAFYVTVFTNGMHYPVTDPGGVSLGQLPPKRLWHPLECRPFAINAPLFGANGSRNRDKKIL